MQTESVLTPAEHLARIAVCGVLVLLLAAPLLEVFFAARIRLFLIPWAVVSICIALNAAPLAAAACPSAPLPRVTTGITTLALFNMMTAVIAVTLST